MNQIRQNTHAQAVQIASRRRRVTRYERVGNGKLVKIVYSLVHSNNEAGHADAREFKVVSAD